MNFYACLINTDIRYTMENLAEIDWADDLANITMLKGDKRFIQLIAHADNAVNCTVEVSTNTGDIKIVPHRVGNTLAFIGHAGWYARNPKGTLPNGPKTTVGDILYNDNVLSIPAGGMACCYLEITSLRATYGVSKAFVNVISDKDILSALSLNIEIIDLEMIKPKDYTFKPEYWQYPFSVSDYYGVNDFSQEHIDILYKQQQFYSDLGGTGVVASIVEEAWGGQTYSSKPTKYPSMIKWIKNSSGKMVYDYTIFDKWISLNQQLGLADKIICYSMLNWGNYITFTKADGEIKQLKVAPTNKFKFKKYWLHFLRDFTLHLDKLDIFDKVYMGFDERINMLGVLKLIWTIKNKDNLTFKTSAAFNHFMTNRKCFDILDRASVGLDEARDNIAHFKKAAGERASAVQETSIYTATDNYPNSFALSMPCESYWTILFAYSCGANGFLRWAYDAWVKNPLEDTTHCSFPAGDCFLVYPAPKDSPDRSPLWSTRLVKLDDGVRDVNILDALKRDAPPHIILRIEKLLHSIKPNYTCKVVQDKSWGASIMRAQWADDIAQKSIPADMATAKQEIVSIISDYAIWKKNK